MSGPEKMGVPRVGGVEYLRGRSPESLLHVEAGSVDAIITDPPYGTNTKSNVYGRRGRWNSDSAIANDDDLSELAKVAPLMARVLKRFGVALVFAAPSMRNEAAYAIEDGGLAIVGVLSWDKGAPGISHRIRYSHEDIIIAGHHGADQFDGREPIISPLRVSRVQHTEHPNEKPVELYRRLIRWALPERGLILDPFAGIGSCAVAAIAERCEYIGAECDPQWWTVAERRIAEAQNRPHPDIHQDSLFGEVA